jgi:hypothetical protein
MYLIGLCLGLYLISWAIVVIVHLTRITYVISSNIIERIPLHFSESKSPVTKVNDPKVS